MDDLDRSILAVLLTDGRASYQEVAARIKLSPNATADRVRRLRASGVITGYRAELDLAALGLTVTVLTDVRVRDSITRPAFERELSGVSQVLAAVRMTGDFDYNLRISCRDTPELEQVVERLYLIGAQTVRSRLVLRDVPLDPARLVAPAPARRARKGPPRARSTAGHGGGTSVPSTVRG